MKTMIEQFADFAASKPADEAYNWTAPLSCALGQFAEHAGIKMDNVLFDGWVFDGVEYSWPVAMYRAAVNPLGPMAAADYTFGALAERLRAEISK